MWKTIVIKVRRQRKKGDRLIMIEGSDSPKINNADKLIEMIQRASSKMNFDEYAKATGLEKEFIFRILKGDIEKVDDETIRRLSLDH